MLDDVWTLTGYPGQLLPAYWEKNQESNLQEWEAPNPVGDCMTLGLGSTEERLR
jgi:hypothetical protein